MDPVYITYEFEHFLWKHHLSILAFIVRAFMRVIFACDIPYKTSIGKGTLFPHHALGIVIHPDAIIGRNCIIEQNVTIGGRSGLTVLPKIGNNVLIGAGASVLGPVVVGDNVQIGAGAVVVHDIPEDCVVVGVPAKIIKTNTSDGIY
ncbi:MAG: serine acetyltransferase [Coprobacillus sp.]|nr:serine acetyltransferase [Coprobacillus sp.]